MAIASANVIFGLGVPVTAALLARWMTPMAFMLLRCASAAALFWAISLFLPRERVAPRDLLVIMGGGLLGIFVSQTCTAWALVYTTPVYYSIIGALTPVTTLLLSALLIGERMTRSASAGVLIGVAGALLVILVGAEVGTGANDLLGISLAALNMLTWVLYLIVTRRVGSRYAAVTQMKWAFTVSAVAMLPLAWGEMGSQPLLSTAAEWSGVLEFAFIVVMATVAGYFAIPYACARLRATTVSVYTNLIPVVSSAVALVIAQDALTWDKPVALALVLLSAYMVGRGKSE